MKELLAALMIWIGANSSLPVPDAVPNVVQVDSVRLACLLEYIEPCDETKLDKTQKWFAYYRPPFARDAGLIVVSDHVDLDTMEGHSVLLHELVHHMQIAAKQTYDIECQAYGLEQQWLHERGSSLQEAFDMDEMYAMIVVMCYEP